MEWLFGNQVLFGEGFLNSIPHFGVIVDYIFKFFTFLGDENFYFLTLPFLYWCIDRNFSFKVAVIFLAANITNEILKVVFHNPRPNIELLSDNIKALRISVEPGGYGFPSGHVMNSFVFFSAFAHHFKKVWVWIVCLLIAFLISFSRLYLGTHYLGDVLGGIVFAIPFIVLVLVGIFNDRKFLTDFNKILLVLFFFVLPFVITIFLTNSGNENILKSYGVLCGLSLGIGLSGKIDYKVWSKFPLQVLKLAIGIAGIALLRFGLKYLFDLISTNIYFDFVRYYLIGFWAIFGAPFIFSKIKPLQVNEDKKK